MASARRISRIASIATPLWVAVSALAHAEAVVHLDNDLWAGTGRDSDYSWGATLTVGSQEPGVDAVSRASQLGIIAMTPADLKSSKAQLRDRPYASLLYFTTSALRIDAAGDRSRFTSLTLGVLGSPLAESIQRGVHEAQGGIVPNGWGHQVSDGGEPTARFVHAEQWLLGDTATRGGGSNEAKLTISGSAGFLTEAGAAISIRWGRFSTPWWTFNPELGDYSSAPIAPVGGTASAPESYAFAGARLKARAYNALLQGQFRHSDVRIAGDDLARFQAEVWAGVTTTFSEWHMSYSVHAASREITRQPAARSLVWASVSFARAF